MIIKEALISLDRRPLDRINFHPWAVPIGLLLLLVISFGLFLNKMGFYWDDWPIILTEQLRGTGAFWRFYEFNRPVSAWIFVTFAPILDVSPINWQICALILRWLTAVAMWWSVTLIWPQSREKAGWAAFLFAVYPVFQQQHIAAAYTQHWVTYLLYFVSLGLMLQAIRIQTSRPRLFISLTVLSVAASMLQLFTMEYFAGLELIRPLILWFILAEKKNLPLRQKIAAILKGWVPYLAGLAAFVIWRLFFLKFPGEDANAPGLLYRMLSGSPDAFQRFIAIALQDVTHLFAGVWADYLKASTAKFGDRFSLFAWAMGILVAGLAAVYFYKRSDDDCESEAGPRQALSPMYQRMLIGAAALLLGMLPVWFTDRQIVVGMYSDRFGMAAMFGASLLIVGLIEWLIAGRGKQILAVALLLGLAAGIHLEKQNEYQWLWTRQARFYWQLKWRAPGIQPDTAIFSEGELFKYVGLYSTSAAINLLYLPSMPDEELSYWFYSLGREFMHQMPEYESGIPIKSVLRNYSFNGSTKDGFVISYLPEENDCLHVLSPDDVDAPGLSPLVRQALSNSDLSRITAESSPGLPPEAIFGPEPEHGWCYLYQKASLAQQLGDWETAAALGDQARDQGFSPNVSSSNTAFEWIPFIEGYARTGRWQDARDLSLAAFQKDSRIDARMCKLWDDLAGGSYTGPEWEQASSEVRNTIGCP